MTTRDLPGYPRRHPSRPDREPHAPDVYEILAEHATALGELQADSQENKRANATILTEVREIKATDRHATAKLIAGLATTAILTIGGILGGQKLTQPAPIIEHPQRSALDIRLDQCRPIQEPGSRAECFERVFEGAPK